MRRPGAVLLAVLAVSLALNLIGAGYLATVGFRDKPFRTIDGTIEFMSARYPEPVAGAVRAKLEERRAALKTALDDMKASRRATREALAGDPLDEARLRAAFAESREKATAFQAMIHDTIVEAAKATPAAERAKIRGGGAD